MDHFLRKISIFSLFELRLLTPIASENNEEFKYVVFKSDFHRLITISMADSQLKILYPSSESLKKELARKIDEAVLHDPLMWIYHWIHWHWFIFTTIKSSHYPNRFAMCIKGWRILERRHGFCHRSVKSIYFFGSANQHDCNINEFPYHFGVLKMWKVCPRIQWIVHDVIHLKLEF